MRLAPVRTAWLLVAPLALLLVGGGCEALVPDTVPAFTCASLTNGCPSDQMCVVATGTCIDKAKACTFAGCGPDMQCDANSQVCIPVGSGDGAPPDASADDAGDAMNMADTAMPDTAPPPDSGACRSTGCPCSGAGSCDSAICGDQLTLTPELFAATQGSVCTRPCCSSSDCDPGSVCFAAGDGGNYCVLPSVVGRGGPGQKKGGEACGGNAECRSGACGTGGTCEDTCCTAAAPTCGPGTSCRFGKFAGKTSFDAHYTFTCKATSAAGNPGDTCGVGSDCKSNLCFATCAFPCSNRCQQPCRSTSGCPSGQACTEVLLSSLMLTTNDLGIVCFQAQVGNAAFGATCAQDSDCRTLACSKTAPMRCTDACFADSDCAGVAGWHCRPTIVTVSGGGSYSVLECGP